MSQAVTQEKVSTISDKIPVGICSDLEIDLSMIK